MPLPGVAMLRDPVSQFVAEKAVMMSLNQRDHAILRAVTAGRCRVSQGAVISLQVDGGVLLRPVREVYDLN